MNSKSVAVLAALFAAGCQSPTEQTGVRAAEFKREQSQGNAISSETSPVIVIGIRTNVAERLDPDAEIIITGQRPGVVELTTCVETADVGSHPVHQGILLRQTTSNGYTNRLEGLVVFSQMAALAPGSHLVNLVWDGPCAANGLAYTKYFAEVK